MGFSIEVGPMCPTGATMKDLPQHAQIASHGEEALGSFPQLDHNRSCWRNEEKNSVEADDGQCVHGSSKLGRAVLLNDPISTWTCRAPTRRQDVTTTVSSASLVMQVKYQLLRGISSFARFSSRISGSCATHALKFRRYSLHYSLACQSFVFLPFPGSFRQVLHF